MAYIDVIAEDNFRKKGFTAKLENMGIKFFGDGTKAAQKAYFEFDDGLGPLSYFIYTKDGKSMLTTREDGKLKIGTYGIGQIISFLLEKKAIRFQVNLESGEEGIRTIPDIIGSTMTFTAHTSTKLDDAGNKSEGFTNFTLTEVELPGKVAPSKEVVVPKDLDTSAWKDFLTTVMNAPMDEKAILHAVNAYAKEKASTPEKLGLGDRKKALKSLINDKFLDTNDDADYVRVI